MWMERVKLEPPEAKSQPSPPKELSQEPDIKEQELQSTTKPIRQLTAAERSSHIAAFKTNAKSKTEITIGEIFKGLQKIDIACGKTREGTQDELEADVRASLNLDDSVKSITLDQYLVWIARVIARVMPEPPEEEAQPSLPVEMVEIFTFLKGDGDVITVQDILDHKHYFRDNDEEFTEKDAAELINAVNPSGGGTLDLDQFIAMANEMGL